MIKEISLRNFKLFRDQTFSFESGTTAVVGPNGSGKTTILEAIEFALFRRVTRKEKSISKVEELIRHGRNKAVVELEFIAPVNGRTYRVVRSIHPGKTNADLFVKGNSDPLESGATRVDDEIEKLLGLNRHAFAALTYVRQGEIDRLSRLQPKKRRNSLYDMMGLGLYSDAQSRIKSKMSSLRKQLKMLETQKERLLEIRKHLPAEQELKKAIDSLESIRASLKDGAELEIVQELLAKVQGSIDEIDRQIESEEFTEVPAELKQQKVLARNLERIISTIPQIAEEQLRPAIRAEARAIFLSIFGDRYSDITITDDYDIQLYNLTGNHVSLMAASGGEDVCVNFALRVAVNTALQKQSFRERAPALIILDEPGAGLDSQRRRWMPEAIAGLKTVEQVLVVTHMEELKEGADRVFSLIPQGKSRQPVVEIS